MRHRAACRLQQLRAKKKKKSTNFFCVTHDLDTGRALTCGQLVTVLWTHVARTTRIEQTTMKSCHMTQCRLPDHHLAVWIFLFRRYKISAGSQSETNDTHLENFPVFSFFLLENFYFLSMQIKRITAEWNLMPFKSDIQKKKSQSIKREEAKLLHPSWTVCVCVCVSVVLKDF